MKINFKIGSKNILERTFLILILALMLSYSITFQRSNINFILSYIFLPLVSLYYLLILRFKITTNSFINVSMSCFFIVVVISSINYIFEYSGNFLLIVLSSTVIFSVFFFFRTYFNRNPNDIILYKITVIILIAASCYGVVRSSQTINTNLLLEQTNVGVLVVTALPSIFLIKSKSYQGIIFFIAGFFILMSLKRSASIAYSLILLTYFLSLGRKIQISIARLITAFLVVTGLALFLITEIDSYSRLTQRFGMIFIDGGSGRTRIFSHMIGLIEKFDPINFIIGKGYGSFFLETISISSAHNDYLETFFAFGILGLFFYLLIHFALINRIIYYYKIRNNLFYAAFCLYSVILVYSFVSSSVAYQYFFIFNYALLGILDSKDEYVEPAHVNE